MELFVLITKATVTNPLAASSDLYSGLIKSSIYGLEYFVSSSGRRINCDLNTSHAIHLPQVLQGT